MRFASARLSACALVFAALIFRAAPALAQLSGHNFTGDFGVQSGSQPAPGVYLALPFFRYDTNTIKDRSGNRLNLPGDLGVDQVVLDPVGVGVPGIGSAVGKGTDVKALEHHRR